MQVNLGRSDFSRSDLYSDFEDFSKTFHKLELASVLYLSPSPLYLFHITDEDKMIKIT